MDLKEVFRTTSQEGLVEEVIDILCIHYLNILESSSLNYLVK